MRSLLEDLFEKAPNLCTSNIKSISDIKEIYQSSQTWRKASDTQAVESNVSSKDIGIVNQWNQVEKPKERN